jgi:Flp pilus assembly pilin Flp
MDLIKAHLEFLQLGIEYNLTKAGVTVRDERGAISTEMAVVMAGLVAIAVVVVGILMSKAESNANNIPDTVEVG